MTTETASTPSAGQKFLRGLGRLAKFLLRLIFVIVIGVLLGAGTYWAASYGVAAVNRQVFQPIQEHTRRLDDLENRYAQDYQRLNERTQALQEQTQAFQDQIAALERQDKALGETLDALQTRLTTTETQVNEMQAALKTAQETVAALETRQATFGPDITKLRTALTKLETALGDLKETTADITSEVAALNATVKSEAPLLALRTDVQLLRAMELLTRARLQLAQNNPGAAAIEVQEARNVLLALGATIPAHQQDALAAIVKRLDLGLANLPDKPRLATDDFEVAWQLLAQGLPEESNTMLLSPLVTPTLTTTETLTATVPVTPTVTPTPKP
ncbi:MAG TPA: hypothetical protein PLJ78_02120 [Anaerolineae bacterium]|nr:hypothetical protein [Anaerolineae bacterium]HQK12721.1 hypothetical protein [Anaerolineae bacterium]